MENWKETKCGKCKIQRRKPICNSCLKYNKFIPITNADRIRAMSDDELAEFLEKVNTAYAEPCMTGVGDCKWEDYPTHDKGCKDCFKEWLQSEVEE